MSIQDDFINDLSTKDDKINVINTYLKKIKETDINDNLSVDIKITNIYIEFASRQLILYGKHYSRRINTYIIIYHPKLYELLFISKTIDEIIKESEEMIKVLDDIYKDFSKDNKYKMCYNLLTMDKDIKNPNALEYCYFLTWATYKKEWTNVNKEYVIKNNQHDILTINITYNLKNLDSIVIYNDVANILAPVLNKNMVEQTERYKQISPKNIAKEPITLYDKNFKRIKQLNTENITVLIDYGNDYFTKCFLNGNEIIKEFANDIQQRKLRCNNNKFLLLDVVNRDIYNNLPINCYKDKLNKKLLMDTYNIMKQIVLKSYNDDRTKTIKNILSNEQLPKILDKHEIPIFKLYLEYLINIDVYNFTVVDNHCCNYIFENLLETPNLMNIS